MASPIAEQEQRQIRATKGWVQAGSNLISLTVLVFLNHTIGARRVSFLSFYLVAAAIGAGVLALFLTGTAGVSPFLVALAIGFLVAGTYHQVQVVKRELIGGDYSVHSYSDGRSWLFPLWQKVPMPENFQRFNHEYNFHRFLQPVFVMGLGVVVLVVLDPLAGGWLLAAGFFLGLRMALEHQEWWNFLRDSIDTSIEQEERSAFMAQLQNPPIGDVGRSSRVRAIDAAPARSPMGRMLASLEGKQLVGIGQMLGNLDPKLQALGSNGTPEDPSSPVAAQTQLFDDRPI